MKRYCLALLAIAAALAITPAAMADTYYFSYSSPVANASGTLVGTEIGNTGNYLVTAGTIAVTYSNSPTYTGTIASPPGCCGADNELYALGGPNGLLLDVGGLEFTTTNGLVNMWGGDNNANVNGSPDDYSITQNNLDWVDFPGTFTISTTPEPSSLLLLGTGLLGLAFIAFRKARASGLVLHT